MIYDIVDLKDGVVISQGDLVRKVDAKGKTLWSKKIISENVVLGNSGGLYAYSFKNVYKLDP
jgi:hypothetical protein